VDRISRSGADEDRASRQIRGAQLRLAFAKEQMAIDDHLRSLFQSEELPGLPPTGSWLKPKHYQRRQRLQCRKLRSPGLISSWGFSPVRTPPAENVSDIPAVPAIPLFAGPSELRNTTRMVVDGRP
jgi:hypothetical protein